MNKLLRWFTFEHLPDDLGEVSQSCRRLATWMDENLSESAEKTVGMRKLLEAKDAFVRARIEMRKEG